MRFILGLIVLVLGALAGWYFLKGDKSIKLPTAPTLTIKSTPIPTSPLRDTGVSLTVGDSGMEKGGVVGRSVITYNDTGFSPTPLTVKIGTTVTFVNESNVGMWVASAVHPTHKVLPGFDQLKSVLKGGTYEYIFTKVGTWKYHNHTNIADSGTVVVTN